MQDNAGVETARTASHHRSFHRREAHTGISNFAVEPRGYGTTTAQLQSQYPTARAPLFGSKIFDLAPLTAMRQAMKSIATDWPALRQLVWQRIARSLLRQPTEQARVIHSELRAV